MSLSPRLALRPLLLCALFVLALGIAPLEAARRQPTEAPIISRITIRGTNIFDLDTNPRLRKFPYNTANALHFRTRDDIIRRELLFKVGDRYDPFLIAETERNLRALSFIRAARVARFPQRDGSVALVVHTNDAWTTEPQLNLGGVNGIQSVEWGFKEKNLFGFGKTIQYFQETGKKDNAAFRQRSFRYIDPRLIGSRWQLQTGVLSNTDGNTKDFLLERPFYSADTRWAARGSVVRSILDVKEFTSNVESNNYEQARRTEEVFVGTKLGGGRQVVNHIGPRYQVITTDYNRNDKTPADKNPPPNRTDRTIFFDFDSSHTDFIEATHLEKMTRVEDINLGLSLQVSPGWSPAFVTGEQDSSSLQASIFKKHEYPAGHLLDLGFSYKGQDVSRSARNELFDGRLRYYHRMNDQNTLVFNSHLQWGQNLDADSLIRLGNDTGLRAYQKDAFIGSKTLAFNLEDRLFFIDELAHLLAVGGALFADSGYAWDRDHPVAIHDMKSDVGAGLRFGLTRSSNEVVIRLDLAYRLNGYDRGGDSRWVVSFGTGQAF